MKTEDHTKVLDYWELPNGNYTAEMKKDDGFDKDN